MPFHDPSGNSGVELENDPPIGTLHVSVDGENAKGISIGAEVKDAGTSKGAFGYLEIRLESDGSWSGVIRDPTESLTMAECGSARAAAGDVCALAAGVEPEG